MAFGNKVSCSVLCKEAMSRWWCCQAWDRPGRTRMFICPSGCSSAQRGKLPLLLPFHPVEACWTCVVRPDTLDLMSWLDYSKQLLTSQCPEQIWLHRLHTFYSFSCSSSSLSPYFYLAFATSSQINNTSLITFPQLVPAFYISTQI